MGKDKVKKFSTLDSKIKKAVFYIAILYTIFIVVRQQITLSKINQEVETFNRKIEQINSENLEYQKTIERLYDLEYIESIARKELGLIRANEKVYIFSKQ